MALELEDPTYIRIQISARSLSLLEELRKRGIYGLTIDDVALRLIDRALADFCEHPIFVGEGTKTRVR